jgi:VWFA-related protein
MYRIRAKKKVLFLTAAIMFFSLINPGFSQEETQHKTIVEKVEVNWWQVPIFAVDKNGNPILDLKDTDVEVWVNGQRIEAFTFYKREFIVSTPVQKQAVDTQQPTEIPKSKAPGVLKSQSIFLLFDVAISTQSCTRRSKDIARKIITGAGPGIQFNVLTIEPFKGLNYICGPSADKKELLDNIDKKVIGKPNERIVDVTKFFGGGSGFRTKRKSEVIYQNTIQSRHGGKEEQVAAYYVRKIHSFFNAFEALYLVFNSIQDNKFVYFFTEGISNNIINCIKAGRTDYNHQLKNAAESLGRGGVVLFIVNPMGVHDATDLVTIDVDPNSSQDAGSTSSNFDHETNRSGEDSLRYMAKESGGKYLEGVKEKIATSLEQMHRAYYEISFPDLPQLKGATRDITIKPKRKDIFIHSLRSLEKSKTYPELNKVEKEILALNLISQNSLLKTKISCQHARVTRIKKRKNSIAYEILLPKEFLNQQLDVYKFWVKDDQEVINLETTSLKTGKRKIKLQFKKKKDQAPELRPYFAFVNGTGAAALVRAIGHEWVDPEEKQKLQLSNRQSISEVELQNILNHAAEYCEKIKQSAFHFFCKEKIVESWKSLFSEPDLNRKLNSAAQKPGLIERLGTLVRRYKRMKIHDDVNTVMNKYTFTYRLIKSGTEIKEERDWFSSKDNVPISRDQVVKPTVFFSERAVFAPLTILARERQHMYDYRFIRYDKRKGRPAVVIETIPKNKHNQQEHSIYGKVWIDRENYSVLGIEADPGSIKGYQALKEIGERIKARLDITLEIEFNRIHNGIRFPTKVHMLEKYRGGPHVSTLKGAAGWERNRTTFTYKDYQFFDVKVEVSIEK